MPRTNVNRNVSIANIFNKPLSVLSIVIGLLSTGLLFSMIIIFNFIFRGTNSEFSRILIDRTLKIFEPKPFSALDCKFHDYSDASSFLNIYEVKKGDTLLSIAKNELGDISKVSELVKYNQDAYPNLSITSPFIEVGWKLLYPPKDFPQTSGRVVLARGLIVDIQKDYWDVLYSTYNGAAPGRFLHMSQAQYKYQDANDYKIGDCVEILSDWPRKSSDVIPLVITPQ